MPWHVGEPVGDKSIKELLYFMPENWTYIQTVFAVEHAFPGAFNVNAGRHNAGNCRVLFYGPASAIASITGPTSGAMAYDTENYRLKYYTGTAWVAFDELLHERNGEMTGDLVVGSAILDGRDPSVDGTRLDTIDEYATCKGVGMAASVEHDDVIALPTAPVSQEWTVNNTYVIVSNTQMVLAGTWLAGQAIASVDASTWKYDGDFYYFHIFDQRWYHEYVDGQALIIGVE